MCDGKSVFEYRHDQKQLVERPIPPQLQGQAIVDGPLPFLFGAEAKKLKDRYWMRIERQPNPDQIWLMALPKFQAQAADFRAVRVILDRQQLLPVAMQVQLPDGSRHEYMFDIAEGDDQQPVREVAVVLRAAADAVRLEASRRTSAGPAGGPASRNAAVNAAVTLAWTWSGCLQSELTLHAARRDTRRRRRRPSSCRRIGPRVGGASPR